MYPSWTCIGGVTATCGLLIPGLLAPAIGTRADIHGTRWGWLAASTFTCCAATALMPLAGAGQVVAGSLLFVLAQDGYMVAAGLYDAYLPSLAPHDQVGRVSGFGWGMGFSGGVAAVLLTIAFMTIAPPQAGGVPVMAFPILGTLYAMLSVPAIVGLRRLDRDLHAQRSVPGTFGGSLDPVPSPRTSWGKQPILVRFLGALFCISDVMVAVAYFSALYFQAQFGMTVSDLLGLALLYQIIALPATITFGYLADCLSLHGAIYLSLIVWIGALLLMVFGRGDAIPVLVVALFASVIGSTQALLRAFYSTLIPAARSSEMFGFNALASRVSTVAGPLLFGVVSTVSGSQRVAMLSVAFGCPFWRLSALTALRRSTRISAFCRHSSAPSAANARTTDT